MTQLQTPGGPVSAAFDGPRDASLVIVLAHGAGAGMNSDFMATVASALGSDGFRVCRFNFLYTELGKKAPDRQPVLEETYNSVLESVRSEHDKVVLGGKSLGGRIASMIAAQGAQVDGLVFLGYPLHPPGRPERIRKAHLPDIKAPMLFVEGTRDPFCPLDTLDTVLSELSAPAEVAIVDDGDHSLKVRKSSGRSTAEAWAEAAAAVTDWLRRTV